MYMRCLVEGKPTWAIKSEDRVITINGNPYKGEIQKEKTYHINEVKILPPCEPTKIILAGLNYSEHAEEVGFDLPKTPLIFLKSISSVIAHKEGIVLPEESDQIEHEAELAIIIGKTSKNISVGEAHEYIFGYTCANDVTARDIQKREGQWARSKSFDTFCPLGPEIVTTINKNARIQCFVNGILKQDGSIDQMVFSIEELVSFASRTMTLYPGDVILTGSPKGSSKISEGDEVEVRIEGMGSLVNKVL